VTITVVAAVPLIRIEFSETAHVDSAGAPPQLSATVCANPPEGATATE
jgi:hypothetical protein